MGRREREVGLTRVLNPKSGSCADWIKNKIILLVCDNEMRTCNCKDHLKSQISKSTKKLETISYLLVSFMDRNDFKKKLLQKQAN